jgi:predicted ABC-type sugar transport system permease subunit
MKKLKMQIRVVIVSGISSLLAGLFAHLALTDIYHGETDVTMEWSVVRISAVVFATFIGASLVVLTRALKWLDEQQEV